VAGLYSPEATRRIRSLTSASNVVFADVRADIVDSSDVMSKSVRQCIVLE